MSVPRLSRALAVAALALAGGDQERGIQLLAQGQFGEAVEAFRAAIKTEGPSAELSYNLALALWRAGQLDEAETAAETAATLSNGALGPLRDGLLGNLRYAAAQAKEAEDLEGALGLARQARDHYLRGAVSAGAPAEMARNLERAEKLIEGLEQKIEEQKKQDEEKKDDQKQDEDKKDDEKQDQKSDDQKDEEQKDPEQKDPEQEDPEQKEPEQQDQEQKDEPGKDEPEQDPKDPEQPEPQPTEEKPKGESPEPKPTEEKPEEDAQPPAPGEQQEGRELTPEEKKQLEERLDEFQQQLLQLRAQQKAQRPKVKKDW